MVYSVLAKKLFPISFQLFMQLKCSGNLLEELLFGVILQIM